MISPITNEEKQKLLEDSFSKRKMQTLENILSFYLHEVILIIKQYNKI